MERKNLGVSDIRELAGERPLNPFVSVDAEKTKQKGSLSSIQQRIARYVEGDAQDLQSQKYGIQPPPIKIFGEEGEREKLRIAEANQAFLEKYKISHQEHEHLTELVFYGELKLSFQALGHTFLVRDLKPETRRYIIQLGPRVASAKGVAHLQIKAVAETLLEIDGIPMAQCFLEKFLWTMQAHTLHLLHKMHLATEKYKMHLYERLPNFCRTPTSQIRYALCDKMGLTINDPRFMGLSEEQIYWHYINIVKTREIDAETVNNRLEYLTWFINPEMAKKLQERKEMHEEADLNMIQKYSFLNGVYDMLRKEMGEDGAGAALDIMMNKMQSEGETKKKDPWEEPGESPKLDVDDPFIQGLKQQAESQNPPKNPEAKMGMFGGSSDWYKKR